MLVKRLYVPLDEPVRTILSERAQRERRHPCDEAALILERTLLEEERMRRAVENK
jgi:hypothetical protein